jgi:hypothetical protein
MPELEKLLNSLYKDLPVNKADLVSLCSFSFIDSIEDKKRIFSLLDNLSDSTGNTFIKQITIYMVDKKYRLKLLINTIYDTRNFS